MKSKYNNVKGLYGGVGMALKTGMADVSQAARVLMRDGVWLVPEDERPKLPVVTTGGGGGKG